MNERHAMTDDIRRRIERAVLRYSAFQESQHPRDDRGRFVVRRTINPEADLKRGWSAWGGEYTEDPWHLTEVGNTLDRHGKDLYDIINAIDDEHTEETASGWSIKSTPEARSAVADWIRDELDVDVQRDPHTGLYGVRHHEGLSSYELSATDLKQAMAEAERVRSRDSTTWLTGGVRGIKPMSYHPTTDPEIFVFRVGDIGDQKDS